MTSQHWITFISNALLNSVLKTQNDSVLLSWNLTKQSFKNIHMIPGMVAHAYSSSYSGASDWRIVWDQEFKFILDNIARPFPSKKKTHTHNMCMCMCEHTYICIYNVHMYIYHIEFIHVYLHKYVFAYIYSYIYTHMHLYTYIYMYISVCLCTVLSL